MESKSMNYEDQLSSKMDRMNEMIKKEVTKCNSDFLKEPFSETQKNNSLNNLKLLLTQSQVFYQASKKEYQRKVTTIEVFFPQKMKKILEDFKDFMKTVKETLHPSISCQIQVYDAILNNAESDFDLLEIKGSLKKNAKTLSEQENEAILGKVLSDTQMQYEKLRKNNDFQNKEDNFERLNHKVENLNEINKESTKKRNYCQTKKICKNDDDMKKDINVYNTKKSEEKSASISINNSDYLIKFTIAYV